MQKAMKAIDFVLNDVIIPPGTSTMVDFNIARLPSGTQIDLPVYIFRSNKPGPTVLFMGGLHGDEINGIETVRELLVNKKLKKLQCGNVMAIPILNIYGFLNFSREVPDGKDINRSFPGSANGSLASRVAHFMSHHILPLADYVIDFHTGGANRYNFPQARFTPNDQMAEQLAKHFNAPLQLESALIDKSFRKQARRYGVPTVVFEGGEAMRRNPEAIEYGVRGALRVLDSFKMLPYASTDEKSITCQKSAWIRAKRAGMLTLHRFSGDLVKKGEVIGEINDPFGNFTTHVKSPKDGVLIGHTNSPLIHQGDAIAHLGTDFRKELE